MSYLNGKSIVVTGGTGSFGKAFIKYALEELNPRRIAVLSRDELKQYEFRNELGDDPRVRWFIGDVRDRDRLMRAFHGVDVVIHAAAMKQVDTAEYNPFECIATNVLGAENVLGLNVSWPCQPIRRRHRSIYMVHQNYALTSFSWLVTTMWGPGKLVLQLYVTEMWLEAVVRLCRCLSG